jgi:hypothetical protein
MNHVLNHYKIKNNVMVEDTRRAIARYGRDFEMHP